MQDNVLHYIILYDIIMLTKWLSSHKCDFCFKDIQDDLYDAVTKYGPWATMCKDCFEKHSQHKLGRGFGQHYKKDPKTNDFIKVEG